MTTPDIRLVPKTDDETARWLPVAMAAYEQARRDAGDSPEQAEAARRLSQEQFFPDGRLIDGHFLFTVVVDGDDVGWLWIGPVDGTTAWYVWDVEVHEAHRGRGLGRATMQLAEDFARSQGATSMRLNVFAYNVPAVRLYESLGYDTAAMHMHKAALSRLTRSIVGGCSCRARAAAARPSSSARSRSFAVMAAARSNCAAASPPRPNRS